jgi:diguanylate cyclase (GGDEF)-like protein/PAS domain S-box-containing protein
VGEQAVTPRGDAVLGALLDRVADAAVVYRVEPGTSEARLSWANESFTALTGWSLAELADALPGQLVASDTDPGEIETVLDGLARGRVDGAPLRLPTSSGQSVRAELTAFTLDDDDGGSWLCAVYRDQALLHRDQWRYRALIEQVNDVVVVVDADLRLVYVSPAVEPLLGFRPEDLVGKMAFDVISLAQSDQLLSLFGGTDVPATPELLEARAVHRDGTTRMLEIGVNDRLGDPAIRGIVVTVRDITDRTEAAVKLRRSEEWAHALLAGGADVVMVTDEHGVVYYVSPGVTPMLGYVPEEVVGTSCFDLIDPEQFETLASEWQDLLADDRDYLPAHFRARHRDGSWRAVDVSARNMLRHPAVQGMVIHVRDVTERSRAEEALRRSEEWAQALVQGGSDIVIVVDREGDVIYASPASATVLGYETDVMLGANAFGFVHPDDLEATHRVFQDEIEYGGRQLPTRVRVRHVDGRWLQLSITFTNMLDHNAVSGVVINARDITERWEAEQLLAQQALALEAVARGAPLDTTLYRVAQMLEERLPGSHCAVGVVADDGQILLRAAPTLDRQTVVALDEVAPTSDLGLAIRSAGRKLSIFHGLGRDPRWAPLMDRAPKLARFSCWSQLITQPGSRETLGALIVFHPESRGPTAIEAELLDRLMYLAAIAIERRNFEAALEHQALHDDLTGLPNRTLLLDRIAQTLASGQRHQTQVAVLFIDLDRFKVINDSLGHSMGDELLKQAANRLRHPLRLGDTLGRLGGDEFLVVCERVQGEDGAVDIAERLIAQMSAPFLLGDAEVFVSASIGIALSSEQPVSAEALIRNADMAMYRAKEQGRSRHAVFEEDLALRAVERHELEQALRSALDEQQFELHYQPLIRLADGGVAGAEALVRWNRPEHGLVEPNAFIPVAEDAGLILPLGSWVIGEACGQAAAWPPLADGSMLRVTINLSARQLADPGLLDHIAGCVHTHGLAPERLCFEITESVLVDDVDAAIATVEKLKALGVLIAIDDFGTGYATLEYLRRFSMADYLKIDRSFVEGVDTGSKETAIVAGAISLAQSLGLTVVAEGVQTEAQVATLRGLGCDLAQGYFFSRPLPAAAAVALLESAPAW